MNPYCEDFYISDLHRVEDCEACMRKREKRVMTELKRRGTNRAGYGWAAKQAAKRHRRRRKGPSKGGRP